MKILSEGRKDAIYRAALIVLFITPIMAWLVVVVLQAGYVAITYKDDRGADDGV